MEASQFVKKWLNRAVIVWQYFFETRISPFIALRLKLFLKPIHKIILKKNILFLTNIREGTGQVIPELDNFLYRHKLGELNAHKKYFWIGKKNDFSRTLISLYGNYFNHAICNTVLFNLSLPLIQKFKDITIDCGLSGLHWELPTDRDLKPAKPWQTYLFLDKKQIPLQHWREYYLRRKKIPNYLPLQNTAFGPLGLDAEMKNFLGERNPENLVLIHLKTNIMNATAAVTDPATYLPTLNYLQKQGYDLVFVGREKIPNEFKNIQILNYAESSVATFEHDLQIFNYAKFSITGGSGIAWLADCLGKPVLYLNSWQLYLPPFNKYCVYIPSLIQNKETGKLPTFDEQFQIFLDNITKNGDKFRDAKFNIINASADDILDGTMELLDLINNLSPRNTLQEDYANFASNNGWADVAVSRISANFIKKNMRLLVRK